MLGPISPFCRCLPTWKFMEQEFPYVNGMGNKPLCFDFIPFFNSSAACWNYPKRIWFIGLQNCRGVKYKIWRSRASCPLETARGGKGVIFLYDGFFGVLPAPSRPSYALTRHSVSFSFVFCGIIDLDICLNPACFGRSRSQTKYASAVKQKCKNVKSTQDFQFARHTYEVLLKYPYNQKDPKMKRTYWLGLSCDRLVGVALAALLYNESGLQSRGLSLQTQSYVKVGDTDKSQICKEFSFIDCKKV